MMKLHVVLFTFLCLLGCKTAATDPDRPLKAPKGYMNETFIKIAYGLGMLDLIESEPTVPDDIEAIKDITYKNIDDVDLQLDIYKQKGLEAAAPTMIFIHGGAWKKGKRQDYLPYLIDYAKKVNEYSQLYIDTFLEKYL